MANNIFGPGANMVVGKVNEAFATAGITYDNTKIIILIDPIEGLKSFVPGRAINGVVSLQRDKSFYIIAKYSFDLSSKVYPPADEIVTPPDNGTVLDDDGGTILDDDGHPILND